MEKTVIPIKELAKRWSCTESYIYKLEGQGLITRTKLSKVCFPIKQIREIELSEEESPTLKTVRELKDMNKKLDEENKYLKKSLFELSKVVYGGNYEKK